MKLYPTSRYTMVGTYPDSYTMTGLLSPDQMDANLHRHKRLTGSLPAFAITMAFQFDTPAFKLPFDQMEVMDNRGVVPWVILWPYGNGPQGGGCLEQINYGEFDDVFRERARELHDWSYGGRRAYMLQFCTEVSLYSYPWAAANNGGWGMTGRVDGQRWPIGCAEFIHAHRRVWHFFDAAGCDVTWNHQTFPEILGNNLNHPSWYYPGRRYVDWLGVPLWVDRDRLAPFGTFEDSMALSLHQANEITDAADLPLYLEVVSQESRTDPQFKSDFFRDVFTRSLGFERVARNGCAIGYWDAFTVMEETEITAAGSRPKLTPRISSITASVPAQMGIDSSPASLAAYREGVSGDWYTSRARLV